MVYFMNSSRIGKYIKNGDRFRDVKEWQAAIDSYKIAVKIDPKRADIWTQLGHCLKESKKFEEAEAAYRQASNLSAENDALLHLAHMFKVQGRIEDALAEFNALEKTGRFDVAAEIQALREAYSAQAVRWIEAADNERDDQKWGKAAELYEAALGYAPELAHIWVQYGHCLKENLEYDKALSAYTEARNLAPEDPDPVLHQAHLLKMLGRVDEALRTFKNLNTLQPGVPEVQNEISFLTDKLLSATFSNSSGPTQLSLQTTVVDTHASSIIKDDEKYTCHISQIDHHGLRGWIAHKTNDIQDIPVDIYVDGVLYTTITASGIKNKKIHIEFPQGLFNREDSEITVITPDGNISASIIMSLPNSMLSGYQYKCRTPAERVSIIIPIYNAYDDVISCLSNVLSYTREPARLILIDDSSTDPRIWNVLSGCAKSFSNVEIFRNDCNLGYTKTVNIGIEHAGTDDVVLLNSDARVTPRWLDGLRYAAATDERIGTVTAMSNRAGVFSAPSISIDNPLPVGWSEEMYAKAFRRNSAAVFPSVPTGNGFCLYIRRSLIREIGLFDETAFPRGYGEENDFCMRATRLGWRHIIDDRTYVFHERSKSFGSERSELIQYGREIVDQRYPEYNKLIPSFETDPFLLLARFRARQLKELTLDQARRNRALFVISTQSGGTPHTNRDLMHALANNWDCWLLICDTKMLTLSHLKEERWEVVSSHKLRDTVNPVTYHSFDYESIVSDWLELHTFDVVHIRHLGWHSLALPRLASATGASVVMSFHDFHVVCPNIKLIDNDGCYCGGTCTSTPGECSIELWPPNSMPHIKNNWVYYWRERYAHALSYCDAFVTTSPSARVTIMKNVPTLSETRFHVVPHGRDFDVFISPALTVTMKKEDQAFRILVPGNINQAKGRDIILSLLEEDTTGQLEFHILGNHNFTEEHPRIVFHGTYNRDDFMKHVAKIQPDVGAVFSIWDETWCHTLTELWAAGVPAMVFDYPTLATRVRESGAGWVYDHKNVKALYLSIIKDLSNPNEISQKHSALRHWQTYTGVENNTAAMAAQYENIYREAISRRNLETRAFLPKKDISLDNK
ncbi:glycosyltransferase [Novacetimonas hansenii]|uniref:Glycosyltransferase n=1 Tax=Novacetimonas hansenii TaxID=436 RepID=A0AAW5EQT4_NOVHA|nr:glycosyltransferase [Novacetimonas hansenii]MCJ8352834.1 glycosyltransferase [Novacetimonas hansenii]